MTNIKLIYIGFSFPNHGKHAGYDQIKKYVNYDRIINCQSSFELLLKFFQSNSIFKKVYTKVLGSRLWLWWVELKLILLALLKNDQLFHIIYGENIYHNLGYFKRKNKIVLTLHQPVEWFKNPAKKVFLKRLKYVDKLIVMSENMEVFFKETFPEKEIEFIPHGVDTDFFKPRGLKQNHVFMVGNWLRDFHFADEVFNRLNHANTKIEITVLAGKDNHKFFKTSKVNLPGRVSDEELLQIYQKTKLVFLPLKEFTANNALLEAASCGCEVLISSADVNLKKEANEPFQYIIDHVDEVVGKILDAIKNYTDQTEHLNVQFVEENYSWKFIGKQTTRFISQA